MTLKEKRVEKRWLRDQMYTGIRAAEPVASQRVKDRIIRAAMRDHLRMRKEGATREWFGLTARSLWDACAALASKKGKR
jgi:hypothetical protein